MEFTNMYLHERILLEHPYSLLIAPVSLPIVLLEHL
jgi:hypothetical protein